MYHHETRPLGRQVRKSKKNHHKGSDSGGSKDKEERRKIKYIEPNKVGAKMTMSRRRSKR